MDAIEKAIRNAFEKGNAEDRSFREKVYRSAFAALDRALQANPGVTVETAINRRKAMQAKIAEIESEFLPAVETAPQATPQATVDGEPAPGDRLPPAAEAAPAQPVVTSVPTIDMPDRESATGGAPSFDGPAVGPAVREAAPGSANETVDPPLTAAADAPRGRVLPVVPDIMPERPLPGSAPSTGSSAEVAPDRDERRARGRRRGVPALFLGLTLLVLIAIGAWWLFQADVFKTPEERGELPVPPATVEDEDFTPAGEATAPQKPGQAEISGDWITVFTPKDPTLVSAPSDAKAEVMEDDTGSFLRLRSGASGSAVSFDVGQGILEQMAGKHAVFVISARAEEGQETQVSVDCNFGELGDCGRKRYAVGHERNEYLFDVQLPDKRPGAAGTIAINSDFDKQGKSVDIYEIRVSAEQ
ncbi:hypothetical protein ASD64_07725 [Mesorhizobium sp. Root157]|uniref:hypothetical protein n=1 Tax=Mesorhizobium sp. Root157 TaxID=1736477 RepID=UPI0006FEC3A4|nr:hypothetical protein [Mesorhizobium sp. Root157]KQZ82995.1 hypothetical protein ASD64_07725 [Mesorhizobium sp. Root157]